jgi:hypothetical protein
MGASNLDCVKFTYNYLKWGAANARTTNYASNTVIACPVDSAYNAASDVVVKPFTVPSNWGVSTDMNTLFH